MPGPLCSIGHLMDGKLQSEWSPEREENVWGMSFGPEKWEE